tara:strand:+ start:17603 stop:20452 length:2850 start_codon:yes stop_codon:yes gene_type:complete
VNNWLIGFPRDANPRTVKSPIIRFERLGCLWKPAQHSLQGRVPDLYRVNVSKIIIVLVGLFLAFGPISGGNGASVVRAYEGDIEAIFGTAVEVRPPNAIVVASSKGLITLGFNSNSEMRIGSESGFITDVSEGDRVISTAKRDSSGGLVALKTIIRLAHSQTVTKHVVGIVTRYVGEDISIQTRNGDVVHVVVPAGIGEPMVGDGITMVARLDRANGVFTAIGFELTSTTVERIETASQLALDKADALRLSQIAIDARSMHLSALDGASRALQRVVDAGRADEATRERASQQIVEIKKRFTELKQIYEETARERNEEAPLLKISGAVVDEIKGSLFTVVPLGEQEADPFSVDFIFDPDRTIVDFPQDLLNVLSPTAQNPQMLADTKHLIEAGSELEVRYSIFENQRVAISIKVKEPRLVDELEAVLNHESLRAFHGVITLVELDDTLDKALGVLIATNNNQEAKVAAKITSETQITLDGEAASIGLLMTGQQVDVQFEFPEVDSLGDITSYGGRLWATTIRARSSAPVGEDHISGIVEALDLEANEITVRPTDGPPIHLKITGEVPVIRNGLNVTMSAIKSGDLVVDATRIGVESDLLTRLVVVARSNVAFTGSITGIGLEPPRLLITGENGQSLNVLVTEGTWTILDGQRVKFEELHTGLRVVSGVYTVAGSNGAFYNVATMVSVESPRVERAAGIISRVNAVLGEVTVLSGKSSDTRQLELIMPDQPLGEDFLKDGQPIQSLSEVERGNQVDIVLYAIDTGVIEKLSVVSDNYIRSRGSLVAISDNQRFAQVKLVNGEQFDLWIGPKSIMSLNGAHIDSLSPVAKLMNHPGTERRYRGSMVPEVLFIRDSLDSHLGVIISIQFQIKIDDDSGGVDGSGVEMEASGVIEVIRGKTWVIDGNVFIVNFSTNIIGEEPEVGLVAKALLVSNPGGTFIARDVNVFGRPTRD